MMTGTVFRRKGTLEFNLGYTPMGVTLVCGWGSLSPFSKKPTWAILLKETLG
jgi:hypothetical protein